MNPATVTTHEAAVLPKTTREKISKIIRVPCRHARYILSDKSPRVTVNGNNVCSNCGTRTTSTWRRNEERNIECNACNLFFRKNGRKRPPSMRRDVIARRHRLIRCEICSLETVESDGNQENFSQLQKPIPCHRQSNESPSEDAITQAKSVKLSHTNMSQSAEAQNVFFSSNTGFSQSLPFVQSNVHYNHQNPMMMGYNAEQTLSNAINMEQQATSSNVDDQLTFTKHSPSPFSTPDVFGRCMTTMAANASANIIRQEAMNKKFSLTDQGLDDDQKELHQGLTEYPLEQGLVNRDVTNAHPFEFQYSELCTTMNPSSDFLNCSSTPQLHEFGTASLDSFSNSLTETFSLFK